MARPLYDDGAYAVTTATVSTPRRYYPITDTTAAIRRDPLWAGLAMSSLAAAATLIYGDLLYPGEMLGLAAIGTGSILAGTEIRLLRIHALGHPPALIVGRRRRIARLFQAIRAARDSRPQPDAGPAQLEKLLSAGSIT